MATTKRRAKTWYNMVEVMCVRCRGHFRYRYPGTGPYRSVCNHCLSKPALANRKARHRMRSVG